MFTKSLPLFSFLSLVVAGAVLASPPHNAAWKAGGMQEPHRGAYATRSYAPEARYYSPAAPAPRVVYAAPRRAPAIASAPSLRNERLTFSYEPRSTVVPAAPQTRQTYSYEPGPRMSNRSRSHTHAQPSYLRQKADPHKYHN